MNVMEKIFINLIIFIPMIGAMIFLFSKKVRQSTFWQATVTPLASIIGSGFLVSTPLLVLLVGKWAPIIMLIVVIVAYALGAAMRCNILYLEPLLKDEKQKHLWVCKLEILSRPILGIAYIISATFYLKLLSAFIFKPLGLDFHGLSSNLLTSIILLFIGITGLFRGLKSLERLAEYSVNTKLGVIITLIISLLVYNAIEIYHGRWALKITTPQSFNIVIKKILGILIIIQGFEISRYMGDAYTASMRIKTMRYAQILSGIIYVVFVTLAMVLFNKITQINEITIVHISYIVAPSLAIVLVIGAIMSQFSASVADIIGGGELLAEASHKKISDKINFLLMAIVGIFLTWVTNIFEIISLASKAFALYYAIHTFMALMLCFKDHKLWRRWSRFFLYGALTLLMLAVVLFGIPSE